MDSALYRRASRRMVSRQRGQAIVLIAIMLAVLIGMAALAIDGGRAYALRRDLQAAVAAAALAAADNLQQTGSYTQAEQAATTSFGTNMRLYSAPSCSPGYGAPNATPRTVTCTFSDGTVFVEVVSALGAAGSQFALTATRTLQLQLARILTNGANPRLAASASGSVNNLLYSPTVAALSQAGCGGAPGNAISIGGSGTLAVLGDIVASGAIVVRGGSRVRVAGDIYARCQPSVPGSVTNACYPSGATAPCTFPDVIGTTRPGYHFADPNYPLPPVAGGSQAKPRMDVLLSPGAYTVDPMFSTGVCYFLSAGVYEWQEGFTNNGDFVSNELKPPDEPSTTNNTKTANQQFWNTNDVNCAGAFRLKAIGGSAVRSGTWAVEVTSVRTDSYAGTNYARESAPSYCQTVKIKAGQAIQVQISNVPGATSYNVYTAPPSNGCSGPFGLAASIPVIGRVTNDDTSGCPSFGGGGGGRGNTCTLGNESGILDATVLGARFAPNRFAPPDVLGSYPPDPETTPLQKKLANQNPDRGVPPAGDRANENQCDTKGGVLATCSSAITPGAVAFYIPSGGCLNDTNNGDNYVFSGYQYNWMVIYEPGAANPPANTCSNVMGAAIDSAYIGLVYVPSAALSVPTKSAFRTKATGGVISNTLRFSGQLPTIIGSPNYAPVPPAAKLVL